MKWFKSKAAKRAEMEEARQGILDGFQRQIEEAEKTADPAERFLKLEECRDSIDQVLAATKGQIGRAAVDKGQNAYLGIAGSATVGTGVLVIGMHFPPALLFLAWPGIFAGIFARKSATDNANARMLQEARPFFDRLEATKGRAEVAADMILKNNLTDLATSPRFDDIVKKAPRVRDHFTAAFAREIAKKENPKDSRPNPGNGFRL